MYIAYVNLLCRGGKKSNLMKADYHLSFNVVISLDLKFYVHAV